jgi:hypothetical protein
MQRRDMRNRLPPSEVLILRVYAIRTPERIYFLVIPKSFDVVGKPFVYIRYNLCTFADSFVELLPTIIFPKNVETMEGSKVHGPLKGTPERNDQEGEDTHKLRQIAHTSRLGQPITVEIRGEYPYCGSHKKVSFTRE